MTAPPGEGAGPQLPVPPWAGLQDRIRAVAARTPLRVKLVAAMLALVSLALVVIGTVTTLALRNHLVERVDGQLRNQIRAYAAVADRIPCASGERFALPSNYLVGISRIDCYLRAYAPNNYTEDEVPVPPRAATAAVALDVPYTVESPDGTHRWRMITAALASGSVLTIGEDLADVESAVDHLVWVHVLVDGAVLIVLAVVAFWLVRMSLRPLAGIEQTAAAIAGGDLTQRVPPGEPGTEVGRLAHALNAMLTQIETAFSARAASEAHAVRSEQRMRQFVADASHELRTPLTSIRGFAELYRQGAVTDHADVVRRIEDEAARMGLLVEDLLLLARMDQERPLTIEPVHLLELLDDAAAAAHAIAPDRAISVETGDGAGALVVSGDQARLRQVVGNLVSNALTHTPPQTSVTLRLYAEPAQGQPGSAVIEVADQGPGLTAEQAELVFERFYRVDKARTRQAVGAPGLPHSGAGLGLAIVAALVAAHEGTVEVDTAPGAGATFRVRLPLAARPESSDVDPPQAGAS